MSSNYWEGTVKRAPDAGEQSDDDGVRYGENVTGTHADYFGSEITRDELEDGESIVTREIVAEGENSDNPDTQGDTNNEYSQDYLNIMTYHTMTR